MKLGQVNFTRYFSEDELHVIATNLILVKTLEEIARRRFPRHHRLALNCMQFGISVAINKQLLEVK